MARDEHAAKLVKQRDELLAKLDAVSSLYTLNHESKDEFIDRLRAIVLGGDK